MSKPAPQHDDHPHDPVEEIVSAIPFVLPLVGGVLILTGVALVMAFKREA